MERCIFMYTALWRDWERKRRGGERTDKEEDERGTFYSIGDQLTPSSCPSKSIKHTHS